MGRKKRDRLEFRFYEVPKGESVLALLGKAWVGNYGHTDERRHFHNLFEVGYCHYGSGHLLLGDRTIPYEDAMISAIPAYYPHSTVSSEVSSWEYLFFDVEELLAEMVPDNSKRLAENLFTVNKRASLLRIEEYPELSATVWRILEEARERRPYRKELIRSLLKIYLLELMRMQEREIADADWNEHAETAIYQVLPALREMLGAPDAPCHIVGYSLAGLFAVYALCRTDAFAGAVSCSITFRSRIGTKPHTISPPSTNFPFFTSALT